MKNLLLVILSIWILCSCSENENHERTNETLIQYTDTLYFQDLGINVLFNDFNLFDTSYQLYEYGMCTPLHNSGYRISDSEYYNEDTLIFLYNYSEDSLLNLTIYEREKIDWVESTQQYLNYMYDSRRANMIATGNKFLEPEVFEIFYSGGLEIGFIGSNSPQTNGQFFTSLQIAGILDSTLICGQLTYMGAGTQNYLQIFERIGKSLAIEKL